MTIITECNCSFCFYILLKTKSKHNQSGQSSTKSSKSNKKTEKCKRSLSKTHSKLSINEILRSNAKENQTNTEHTNPNYNSCSSGNNNNNNNNGNNANVATSTANNWHVPTGSGAGHGSSGGNGNSHNIYNNHHHHTTHGNNCGNNNNNNNNNNHNNNSGGNGGNNIKSNSWLKPPTKVKSGSWKRSEKQISTYSTISGKKSKSLRKLSPNWLKLPNSAVKIADKETYDSTSVCRPGTLYSDVLFGAGSSCLVKIKTLTPRRNTNAAQKSLTKALIKSPKTSDSDEDGAVGGVDDGGGSGSSNKADNIRAIFPSLNEFNKKSASGTIATGAGTSAGADTGVSSLCTVNGNTCGSTSSSTLSTSGEEKQLSPRSNNDDDDEDDEGNDADSEAEDGDDGADVVIESNGIQNMMNGFNDVTYGSYLENHFRQMNGADSQQRSPPEHLFTVDIPKWNFWKPDVSSEGHPKFLRQFDDEHYLKAEKMALLGLKLALGNNTHQGKFKF